MQGGEVLDFADSTVQAQMDTSLDLYRTNEFVVAGTLSSWWEDLKEAGGAPGVRFLLLSDQYLPHICILHAHGVSYWCACSAVRAVVMWCTNHSLVGRS